MNLAALPPSHETKNHFDQRRQFPTIHSHKERIMEGKTADRASVDERPETERQRHIFGKSLGPSLLPK
jgi:hypothetical protein